MAARLARFLIFAAVLFSRGVLAHEEPEENGLWAASAQVEQAFNQNKLFHVLNAKNSSCSLSDPSLWIESRITSEGSGPNSKPFLSTRPCAEVFADQAPRWLTTKPGAAFYSQGGWRPFCTLAVLGFRAGKFSIESGSSRVPDDITYFKSTDACARGPSAVRGGDGYKSPSRKELRLRLMSDRERAEYVSGIMKVREQVAVECCGKDLECSDLIRKTQIRFCKPEKRDDVSDKCTDSGTYFTPPQFTQRTEAKKKSISLPRIQPGQILFAPIASSVTSQPMDSLEVVAHEFSHACSFYKRFAWTKSGPDELSDLLENESRVKTNCKVTPTRSRIFARLLSESGYGPPVAACVDHLGYSAQRNLWSPGDCKGVCPSFYMEEAFAELAALHIVMGEKRLFEYSMTTLCGSEKDLDHPLGADIVQCALLDNNVKLRLETNTRCTK